MKAKTDRSGRTRVRFKAGILLLISLILLGMGGCKDGPKRIDGPSEEISFTKEGELEILRAETDTVLAKLDIEIADTEYETQTGLMYRRDMAPSQGMLFIFDSAGLHSFYMKNTLIPLDLLFIDEDLRVATIHKNAQPLDASGIPSRVPVQYVLEVRAGLTERWGVSEGDKIRFERSK